MQDLTPKLDCAKSGCQRCGQRVGWIGVVVNLILVVIKIFVGISAGSRACLADGLHSGSNIVNAFAIFISRKLTGKPIDQYHPYGHGKVEFITAAAVGVVIIILTLALVITALDHIIYKPVPPPHMSALLVAIISIISNELLFRYFLCVGTQLRSQTIIANAWANRADCFSSLAVIIGIIGSRLGLHHLDPIAAIVVACIIIKVCVSCIKDAIAGLMDRSVPEETLKDIQNIVENIKEVQKVNYLRARLLGNKIWADLSVQVPPKHTIRNCEEIRAEVIRAIQNGIRGVGEIVIDFEPVG